MLEVRCSGMPLRGLFLVLLFLEAFHAQLTTPTLPFQITYIPGKELYLLNVNVKAATTTVPPIDQSFWTVITLQVPQWIDVQTAEFRQGIHDSLRRVLLVAFERQQEAHYGQQPTLQQAGFPVANRTDLMKDVEVEILSIERVANTDLVRIVYAVKRDGKYILSTIVASDINEQLSTEELGLNMGYVTEANESYISPEDKTQGNVWVILAVVGAILSLLLCGWCLLFTYYNTFGKAFERSGDDRRRLEEQTIDEATGAVHGADSLVPIKVHEHHAQTEITGGYSNGYQYNEIETLSEFLNAKKKLETEYGKTIDLTSQTGIGQEHQTLQINPSILVQPPALESSDGNKSVVGPVSVTSVEKVDRKSITEVIEERTKTLDSVRKGHQPLDLRPVYGDFAHLINGQYTPPHFAGNEVERLYDLSQIDFTSVGHPRPKPTNETEQDAIFTTSDWNVRQDDQYGAKICTAKNAQIRKFLVNQVTHMVRTT